MLKKFLIGTFVVVALSLAGSAFASYDFGSTTLKVGSRGDYVKTLQTLVGASPVDGIFGLGTKGKVMAWQASNGLVADGVFGPASMAKANLGLGGTVTTCPVGTFDPMTGLACGTTGGTFPAGCTSTVGYSTTTGVKCDGTGTTPTPGVLTGEGSVKEFSVGSADESSTAEGQTDVELVAFDVELENDGDLKLDRFDLYMGEDTTVNGESSKPWKYFDTVKLFVDNTEVKSMDVSSSDDWTEYNTAGTLLTALDTDQAYRLRFAGLSSVLKSDETTKVSVKFDIASTVDTADDSAIWNYGINTDSFRFIDGTGYMFTDGDTDNDSFTFDIAETATLALSSGSNDPDALVLPVSDNSDSNGVTIGEFKIKETEGVDVNFTEITVVLSTSDTITDVVKKLYLYNGSTLVGSENVTSTSVVFDNIDLDLSGDSNVTLIIKADFDDTNDQVRYQDGDTIAVASINLSEFTDEFDNDAGDISETGSYASETHSLYATGIAISNFTSSYAKNTSTTSGINDTVEFTLKFDVTAFGDEDVWVEKTCIANATPAANWTTDTVISLDGDANSSSVTCTSLTSTGTSGDTGYKVEAGETEHFTITVLGDAGEAGGAGSSVTFAARLESLGYNLTTDAAGDLQYAVNMADYYSNSVTVYDR